MISFHFILLYIFENAMSSSELKQNYVNVNTQSYIPYFRKPTKHYRICNIPLPSRIIVCKENRRKYVYIYFQCFLRLFTRRCSLFWIFFSNNDISNFPFQYTYDWKVEELPIECNKLQSMYVCSENPHHRGSPNKLHIYYRITNNNTL